VLFDRGWIPGGEAFPPSSRQGDRAGADYAVWTRDGNAADRFRFHELEHPHATVGLVVQRREAGRDAIGRRVRLFQAMGSAL